MAKKINKVGFAIVGYGVIGRTHAKAMVQAQDAELVAVCDIDPAREAVLRKDGFTVPFYTSTREMYRKQKDIDAVSVCTYSGIHYKAAVEAAGHGVHVLCEKPLDVTVAHMDRMIEACDRANVKLGCIFQRRTREDNLLIRKALKRNLLGRLLVGDICMKYYRSPAYYRSAGWRGTWKLDGGGALMNQAIHGIDQLVWLVGDVESVFSYSATLARDIEVEDTSLSVLRFRNGALGHITGTTSIVGGRGSELFIHGDRGTITQDENGVTCKIGKLVKGTHEVETVDLAERLGRKKRAKKTAKTGDNADGTATDNTALPLSGHAIQIQDLCDAIRRNREPLCPGPEARKAVELILAIYRSARTGREVTLPKA